MFAEFSCRMFGFLEKEKNVELPYKVRTRIWTKFDARTTLISQNWSFSMGYFLNRMFLGKSQLKRIIG